MRLAGTVIFFLSATLLAKTPPVPSDNTNAPYRNAQLPVEQRVKDLLHRMTLEEKTTLLSGSGWMESAPIPRLGIPAIKMADGPSGIREWTGRSALTNGPGTQHTFTSTAFPAGINIGASWDPELAREVGSAIGAEVASVGRDMILGPTVNIQRTPLWGRNFESFGEDPFLTGQLAAAYIQGVQRQGIIASVKHFVANNQEFERHRVDVTVSERALKEIYTPAFETAIKDGNVWSVMSAYNKVNGVYCAESPLLKSLLEHQWGFKGFVISDWGSTYNTTATVNAGMDLEMPGGAPMKDWLATSAAKTDGNDGGYLTADKVVPLVRSGAISEANLDDNVSRILRIIFISGLFDHPHTAHGEIDTPSQRTVARKAAEEGLVLLKNEGAILPLDRTTLHSLAVIGPNAAIARTGGGGSSLVRASNVIAPLDAIREQAGRTQVNYALGVAMAGEDKELDTPETRKKLLDEAVAVTKESDIAIVFVGYSDKFEHEGADRKSMDLPDGQDDLVEAVSAANPKTIVVLNAGDPVTLTRWVDKVHGVIDAFYGGEEGGHAIADVLFGTFNPSGRLPFTFLRKLQDSPSYGNYPSDNLHVTYAEGIYVGYRYFDRHSNVEPLFPFGYGLSYTNFTYSDLVLPQNSSGEAPMQVSVKVKNTGTRPGAEVVQLYISDQKSSVDRPMRELKGFRRVQLTPGEVKTVTFTLTRRDLSYFSVSADKWVAEPGYFGVEIGSSSRNLRIKGEFALLK